MEYTDEMYKEDYKIARYWIYCKCKNRGSDALDLMQVCLMSLFKNRCNFDINRGRYFIFASKIVRSCIHHWLVIKNAKKRTAELVSLDCPCSTSEDESCKLSDIIPCEVDFNSNLNCQYILDVGFNIINRSHFKSFKKISSLYLMGLSITDIAKRLNITKQGVSSFVQKFRKLLRAELIKDGFLNC